MTKKETAKQGFTIEGASFKGGEVPCISCLVFRRGWFLVPAHQFLPIWFADSSVRHFRRSLLMNCASDVISHLAIHNLASLQPYPRLSLPIDEARVLPFRRLRFNAGPKTKTRGLHWLYKCGGSIQEGCDTLTEGRMMSKGFSTFQKSLKRMLQIVWA